MKCVMCGKELVTSAASRCWDCNHKFRSSSAKISLAARASEIRKMKASGMTMVEIARSLGISRQRAYQILEGAKND